MRNMYGKGSLSGNESTLQAEKIFEQLKKEDLQSSGKSKKYLERTRF